MAKEKIINQLKIRSMHLTQRLYVRFIIEFISLYRIKTIMIEFILISFLLNIFKNVVAAH